MEAARSAKKTIWVSAYFVGGSAADSISLFYNILKNKAREGVKVVILCEYGPGTSTFVRDTALNFSQELAREGVQVLFLRERRVLHKKMVIVDGQSVILGSSNLTDAGMLANSEMNVRIVDPTFTREATDDFKRLLDRALTIEAVRE